MRVGLGEKNLYREKRSPTWRKGSPIKKAPFLDIFFPGRGLSANSQRGGAGERQRDIGEKEREQRRRGNRGKRDRKGENEKEREARKEIYFKCSLCVCPSKCSSAPKNTASPPYKKKITHTFLFRMGVSS